MDRTVAFPVMDEERRFRARRIAEARYGFRWHLPVFIFVNAGLLAIWFFAGQGFFWPVFPLVFWGLGLGAHYVSAYRAPGQDWIAGEMEKIMRTEPEKKPPTPRAPAKKAGP